MSKALVDRLVREVLRHGGDESRMFALVDSARDPEVYPSLLEPGLELRCLFAGDLPPVLASAAPYLVELDPDSVFVDVLREHWGDAWGVLFRARADIEALRRHFRKLNVVRGPDGQRLFFRYYDPRVLRVYLPTCTADELRQVFGPVDEWIVEGESGEALRYRIEGEALSVSHQAVEGAGPLAEAP